MSNSGPHISIIVLTIGIPGCGKTTWVKNEFLKKHKYAYVISSDQIRKEITGSERCDPKQSQMIHDEIRKRVKNIIDDPENYGGNKGMGPTIIVDATNTDVQEWLKFKELNATLLFAKVFDVDVDESYKRMTTLRQDRIVPKEVLQEKWKELQNNKKYLEYIFNMLL